MVNGELMGLIGKEVEVTAQGVLYRGTLCSSQVKLLRRPAAPAELLPRARVRGLAVDPDSWLAAELGGGGHPNASGVVFKMGLEEVKALVLPKTLALVKKSIPA